MSSSILLEKWGGKFRDVKKEGAINKDGKAIESSVEKLILNIWALKCYNYNRNKWQRIS